MLDVAQAAKRLGICEETVRRRIRTGEIPAIRVGSGGRRPTYRIPEAYLVRTVKTPEDELPGTITTRDGT